MLAEKIAGAIARADLGGEVRKIAGIIDDRSLSPIIAAELEPVRDTIADVLATERPFIGKASAADLEGLLALLIDGSDRQR